MCDTIRFLELRAQGRTKASQFHQSFKQVRQLLEEHAAKPLINQTCELSGEPRATFLVDFSPNKLRAASTHGDHSVRVTDVLTGKCTHVLTGHPRTPWCLAFNPVSDDILASGCLGGEVHIWDLHGGGSEVLRNPNEGQVITSLAFSPAGDAVVFATLNKVYFWAWTRSKPFALTQTKYEFERVRWLRFDPFGRYLYTGIANNSSGQRVSAGPASVHSGPNETSSESGEVETGGRQALNRRRYSDVLRRISDLHNMRGHQGPTQPPPDMSAPRSPVQEEGLNLARQYARQVTSMSSRPTAGGAMAPTGQYSSSRAGMRSAAWTPAFPSMYLGLRNGASNTESNSSLPSSSSASTSMPVSTYGFGRERRGRWGRYRPAFFSLSTEDRPQDNRETSSEHGSNNLNDVNDGDEDYSNNNVVGWRTRGTGGPVLPQDIPRRDGRPSRSLWDVFEQGASASPSTTSSSQSFHPFLRSSVRSEVSLRDGLETDEFQILPVDQDGDSEEALSMSINSEPLSAEESNLNRLHGHHPLGSASRQTLSGDHASDNVSYRWDELRSLWMRCCNSSSTTTEAGSGGLPSAPESEQSSNEPRPVLSGPSAVASAPAAAGEDSRGSSASPSVSRHGAGPSRERCYDYTQRRQQPSLLNSDPFMGYPERKVEFFNKMSNRASAKLAEQSTSGASSSEDFPSQGASDSEQASRPSQKVGKLAGPSTNSIGSSNAQGISIVSANSSHPNEDVSLSCSGQGIENNLSSIGSLQVLDVFSQNDCDNMSAVVDLKVSRDNRQREDNGDTIGLVAAEVNAEYATDERRDSAEAVSSESRASVEAVSSESRANAEAVSSESRARVEAVSSESRARVEAGSSESRASAEAVSSESRADAEAVSSESRADAEALSSESPVAESCDVTNNNDSSKEMTKSDIPLADEAGNQIRPHEQNYACDVEDEIHSTVNRASETVISQSLTKSPGRNVPHFQGKGGDISPAGPSCRTGVKRKLDEAGMSSAHCDNSPVRKVKGKDTSSLNFDIEAVSGLDQEIDGEVGTSHSNISSCGEERTHNSSSGRLPAAQLTITEPSSDHESLRDSAEDSSQAGRPTVDATRDLQGPIDLSRQLGHLDALSTFSSSHSQPPPCSRPAVSTVNTGVSTETFPVAEPSHRPGARGTVSSCDVTTTLSRALAAVHCGQPTVPSTRESHRRPFRSNLFPSSESHAPAHSVRPGLCSSTTSTAAAATLSDTTAPMLPTSIAPYSHLRQASHRPCATTAQLLGSQLRQLSSGVSNQASAFSVFSTSGQRDGAVNSAVEGTSTTSNLSLASALSISAYPRLSHVHTTSSLNSVSERNASHPDQNQHSDLASVNSASESRLDWEDSVAHSQSDPPQEGPGSVPSSLYTAANTQERLESRLQQMADTDDLAGTDNPSSSVPNPVVERLQNLSASSYNLSRSLERRVSELHRRISDLEENYNRRMRVLHLHSEYITGLIQSNRERRMMHLGSPYLRRRSSLLLGRGRAMRSGDSEASTSSTASSGAHPSGGQSRPGLAGRASSLRAGAFAVERNRTPGHPSLAARGFSASNSGSNTTRASESGSPLHPRFRPLAAPSRRLWGPDDYYRRLSRRDSNNDHGGSSSGIRSNNNASSREDNISRPSMLRRNYGQLININRNNNSTAHGEEEETSHRVLNPSAPAPGSHNRRRHNRRTLFGLYNDSPEEEEEEEEDEEEEVEEGDVAEPDPVPESQGDSWYQAQVEHLHPDYEHSVLGDGFGRQDDSFHYIMNSTIAGAFLTRDEQALASNFVPQTHRIQRWSVVTDMVPDISDATANVVVHYCKLHNDASCCLSKDGKLLAAFVPTHRGFPDKMVLGVFSLENGSFAQCLYTKSFGPNAISVSISPESSFVLVGMAAKRLFFFSTNQMVGQVYKMVKKKAGEMSMRHTKDLFYYPENRGGHCSVNSASWLPCPGMGLVFGTNKGDLVFSRPGCKKMVEREPSPPPAVRRFARFSDGTTRGPPTPQPMALSQRIINARRLNAAASSASNNSNGNNNSSSSSSHSGHSRTSSGAFSRSGWRTSGTQTTATSVHRSAATQTRDQQEEEGARAEGSDH